MRICVLNLCLLLLALGLQSALARHQRMHKTAEGGSVRRRQNLQQEPQQNLPATGVVYPEHKIPHILHYIYLSGFEQFAEKASKPGARMARKYYDSCTRVHSHWEVKFWDQEMADKLIKEHYAWFLPVWQSYNMEVKQADVLRAFIMHHHGGLYLDLDIECYDPAEKLFRDHDAWIQGSGWEGINNAAMASAPGQPLWTVLFDVLSERHNGSTTEVHKNMPLYQTGPWALAEAVKRYLKVPVVSGFDSLTHKVDGSALHVYALGEAFFPCWGVDAVCNKHLERGLAKRTWDMTNLAGRHMFAGTWNTPELLAPALEQFKKSQ